VKIPKARGQFRTVFVPNKKLKQQLRALLPELRKKERQKSSQNGVSDVAHGFICGRSPITNAKAHINYQFTLSLDLKDWFDTCRPKFLTEEQAKFCLVDGRPPQGFPTSPTIANICAVDMDVAIVKLIDGSKIVYTRYADDLTFSFEYESSTLAAFNFQIRELINRFGFKVSEKKTKYQKASIGRRIITGIAVDSNGIYPTRKVKRKLRAARHQKRENNIRGLKEWCKLKDPKFWRVQLPTGEWISGDILLGMLELEGDSDKSDVKRRILF
jgi:RNA-directed DNA polymerase